MLMSGLGGNNRGGGMNMADMLSRMSGGGGGGMNIADLMSKMGGGNMGGGMNMADLLSRMGGGGGGGMNMGNMMNMFSMMNGMGAKPTGTYSGSPVHESPNFNSISSMLPENMISVLHQLLQNNKRV